MTINTVQDFHSALKVGDQFWFVTYNDLEWITSIGVTIIKLEKEQVSFKDEKGNVKRHSIRFIIDQFHGVFLTKDDADEEAKRIANIDDGEDNDLMANEAWEAHY